MPILEIEIVGEPEGIPRSTLAQRIADAAGGAFKSGVQGTWVRVHVLPIQDYAENGGAQGDAPPVFVRVLKGTLPDAPTRAAEIGELTEAIALACNRPSENVHICYEPAASGRIAFGGRLA